MLLSNLSIESDFSYLISNHSWSFKEIKRSETNYITHGYHRYPAKFIPQIVNKLILNYTSTGDTVFDPFGGCGTTLVEAKTLGRKSIGFDINPVAKLITETKITPLNPNLLEKYFIKFSINLENSIKHDSTLIHSERINYWFEPPVIRELDNIYLTINEIKNYRVRRFYLCAFSHILKNCSRWLMKSIKPQIDPNKIHPNVESTFRRHINQMMSKNKEFYELLKSKGNLNTSAKMKLSDSTKRFPLQDNSVDLIVTSPPYVTSYEYADLHQLILLWLGDDPQRYPRWYKYTQEYQAFREKFIGTKVADNKDSKFLSFIAHKIVSQLPNNRKYAKSVARYFSDMQKALSEMYRVLKHGKKICVIIGNTTLAGTYIRNAEVAAEQMENQGFILKDVIKREVSNKMITPWRDKVNGRFTNLKSSQKMRVYEHEYILIAEKPKNLSN